MIFGHLEFTIRYWVDKGVRLRGPRSVFETVYEEGLTGV